MKKKKQARDMRDTTASDFICSDRIRIGTRGSPLALAQAYEVRDHLFSMHGKDSIGVDIQVISTRGDRMIDQPLSKIGGKGLFTGEIEKRLHDGDIDIAVHSAKDMPTILPEGLELSCYLPREAPGDAFISNKAGSIEALPAGATVGTASLRRQALVSRLRPDVSVLPFRGNVQSRLRKLKEGVVDATLLAQAGLNRLGLQGIIASLPSLESFPPAPGQGTICVESRTGDENIRAILSPLNDSDTAIALTAERAFVAALEGSCRMPIAGYACLEGDELRFHGMILSVDGKRMFEENLSGSPGNAAHMGEMAAKRLRDRAGDSFFSDWS